jgi:hypothetical protein
MTVRRVMIEEDDKETERAAATTVTEEEARVLATLAAAVDHMMIGTDAIFLSFFGECAGNQKKILRVFIGAAASTRTASDDGLDLDFWKVSTAGGRAFFMRAGMPDESEPSICSRRMTYYS